MNWQDAFKLGGSDAANSLASSYSQSSGLADAFSGNKWVSDLARNYPAPSSTVPADFFTYSPDKYSGIDWNTMIANPDVLEGVGDSYPDLFKNGVDFLKDFTSDEKSQFFDAQKAAAGLPTDKSRESWYQQVSPSVGIYGGLGSGSGYGYGSVGSGAAAIQAANTLGAMYPQMSQKSPGLKDYIGAGMRMAGDELKYKALYAINPVLGAVEQFYPGGATEAFKDVGKVTGAVGNKISKGIGSVVKPVQDFLDGIFCDERLKVDIAPLESTEVNDELAQMAFFVKGIRECS